MQQTGLRSLRVRSGIPRASLLHGDVIGPLKPISRYSKRPRRRSRTELGSRRDPHVAEADRQIHRLQTLQDVTAAESQDIRNWTNQPPKSVTRTTR
jgi:hypothetical protein